MLQNIQDQYAETCNFVPLRFTAATFGALTAPLFFLIMRAWGGSVRAAVFAACLFMFDNLNLIESRLVLIGRALDVAALGRGFSACADENGLAPTTEL